MKGGRRAMSAVARVPRAWTGEDAAHFVNALVPLWLFQRGQIPWSVRSRDRGEDWDAAYAC